jgi:LPXTG-motif cell wall-anchored protein
MKKLAAVAAMGIAAALVSVPLSAQAVDPWPGDDQFNVGSAQYQFSEYGLYYMWDTADVYDLAGYIEYPMTFYWDSTDYFYCGDPSLPSATDYTHSVVNTLGNGDVTIDCPSWELPAYAGLVATVHFRMYAAETGGGYLIRQWVELENTTGADISLGSLSSFQYPDTFTYTPGTTGVFLTSSGATAPVGINDSWFISGEDNGSAVYQTTVWAKTGSASAFGIESVPYGDNVQNNFTTAGLNIPAGKTLNFLQFTTVTIPATADAPGATAAFAAATAQASEFDQFSGRLTDGLDPSLEYIGWGSPAAPALASTGTDTAALLPIVGGAAALVLLGVATVVITRRRRLS